MTKHDMVAVKAYELLKENGIIAGIGFEMYHFVLVVSVRGDWKHDHLFSTYLLENNLNLRWLSKKITRSDGSDWYSADHYYEIL